mmetsp:Transcript_27495/g.32510  ORF Transcript_27495/g.32510 Transcript_27495/m.32510 type:complete len:1206 (+) Transcript_27495:135-3752(+)
MADSEDDSEEEEVKVEVKVKPGPSEKESSTKKRKKRKDTVTFCITDCKYEVIFDAVKAMGWKLVGSTANEEGKHCGNDELVSCNVHWVDVANVHERMSKMAPWQHINHFPGMTNIARKAKLASNLEKMRREFPKEYGFYPRTWVLPLEMGDFRTQFDGKGISSRVYIIKPDAGCQGRGIFLTQDINKVPTNEQMVAQQYIRRPLLIDGFKFDLRVYVLVTSCSPLRMYMFHDGLVRLCTSEYVKPTQENLSERCMHLTNYAINKMSDNFVQNDGADKGEGSKRSLKWFMEWVAQDRGEAKARLLWSKIGSVAVKVVSSILPTLQREYGEKFERNKNLREFRRRAEATAAAIAEAKASMGGGDIGNGSNNNNNGSSGTTKGFAFGSGREDASHRTRRAEAAAAALERLKEEEELMKRARELEKGINGNSENEDQNSEPAEGSHCFELLGVDIMIDQSLKPWLIEINHLPSFATDSVLDKDVKSSVIQQTLKVVTATPGDRKKYDEGNKRDSGHRLYGRTNSAATNVTSTSTSGSSSVNISNSLDSSSNSKNHRPSISPIETRRPETISVSLARKKIVAVYSVHAPERLAMVDALLTKYNGREAKLVAAVESKYGATKTTTTTTQTTSNSSSSSVVSTSSTYSKSVVSHHGFSKPSTAEPGDRDRDRGGEGVRQSHGSSHSQRSGHRELEGNDDEEGREQNDQNNENNNNNGNDKPGAAGLVPKEGAWNHILSFDSAVSVPRAGVIPSMRVNRRSDSSSVLPSPLPSHRMRSNYGDEEDEEDEEDRIQRSLFPDEEREQNDFNEQNQEEQSGGGVGGRGGVGGKSQQSHANVENKKHSSQSSHKNRNNESSSSKHRSSSNKSSQDLISPQQPIPTPTPKVGDLCDVNEARRRIEDMYSLRWRHGLTTHQHAQVLAFEDDLLADFDRIFPVPKDLLPPPQTSSTSNSQKGSQSNDNVSSSSGGGDDDDDDNEDGDGDENNGKSDNQVPLLIPDYGRMFTHAFEYEEKKLKRMYGTKPSQSTISNNSDNNGLGGNDSENGPGAALPLSSLLPPIGGGGFCFGGGFDEEKGGRNVFGDPFKQGKIERAGDAKSLPKPGPKQAAAAERLTRGYSVKRQTQSAPGVGLVDGNGNNEGGSSNIEGGGSQLGNGEEEGSRYAEQIAYAKKLRERAVANKNKRTNAVALKPTMYCFSDTGPLTAGNSNHFGQVGF